MRECRAAFGDHPLYAPAHDVMRWKSRSFQQRAAGSHPFLAGSLQRQPALPGTCGLDPASPGKIRLVRCPLAFEKACPTLFLRALGKKGGSASSQKLRGSAEASFPEVRNEWHLPVTLVLAALGPGRAERVLLEPLIQAPRKQRVPTPSQHRQFLHSPGQAPRGPQRPSDGVLGHAPLCPGPTACWL